MRNPIENLGDYNKMRIALQAKNGDLGALYKSIGNTAVAKAAPWIFVAGMGSCIIVQQAYGFWKDRKQKIKNESALRKKFVETIRAESSDID